MSEDKVELGRRAGECAVTEIPIETLRFLYKFYYNPATDWRDPPEITAAWREIAERAGLDEEMKYDETR